jgi:laccase
LEYGYLSDRGVLVSGADFNLSFPDQPDTPFDYTGPPLPRSAWYPEHGTRLSAIRFNSTVQLILQDTSIFEFETHPFHLHGYSVYIVGKGYGNYDPATSPASFNLINPPLRNTYGVPSGGWLALRFVADNPGVWLLHCHLEIHTSWGMETAFFVREGNAQDQLLPSPPRDYPRC